MDWLRGRMFFGGNSSAAPVEDDERRLVDQASSSSSSTGRRQFMTALIFHPNSQSILTRIDASGSAAIWAAVVVLEWTLKWMKLQNLEVGQEIQLNRSAK
ncbi:hypothetical protein Q1695_012859 [Nippostrongylus brasiliensis]|nr:hypothetical protein Q1695_012859 [Nippostrongylus brasiliensis]